MDAGQAWIWTLLPLFLHMINSTSTTSLDSLQMPKKFDSVENLALEENDPPFVPTYRLLTSAPAGQSSLLYPQSEEESTHHKPTPIDKIKYTQIDTRGDYPWINGNKTKLNTMNQSNSFKTARKKDQPQTPLSEEDANNNQRKKNTTVSNDSGKTPDTSTNISDSSKLSKENNRPETHTDMKNEKYIKKNSDIPRKNNITVPDTSRKRLYTSMNSSNSYMPPKEHNRLQTHLPMENKKFIQKNKDIERKKNTTVSDISGKRLDTSMNTSDSSKLAKENNRPVTHLDKKNEKYSQKNKGIERKKNTTASDISGKSSDTLTNTSDSSKSKENNRLEKPKDREDLEFINGEHFTFSNQNDADTGFLGDQSKRITKNKNRKPSENDQANQLELQGLKVKPLPSFHRPDLMRPNEMSDMIMSIDQEQPRTYRTAFAVQHKVRLMELRNSTERFMAQFNKRYAQLPHEEADNIRWSKFSRAVVETFVLDFSRLYDRKPFLLVGHMNQHHGNLYHDELDYNETYNLALSHLREKKWQTAQQFAVPVKSAADALRVMLDVPVGIVQSKCKLYMSPWQCHAHYLSKLIDEAEMCENIWHHAELHLKMLTLEYDEVDPTEIIIKELELQRKFIYSKKASYLFDFILHVIKGLRNRLRKSLITNAAMYYEVKDMQRKGLLGCFKIDQVLSTLNFYA